MTSNPILSDTIAAIATPPGRGGVGIIRISGSHVATIAEQLLGFLPKPRSAVYSKFKDNLGNVIDHGICIFFPQPNSFTGEDVLELHGHGGPVVLDTLLNCVISYGARIAEPGEFTKRAFLNDKMDLIQAEAIADLIDASSQQAAKSAIRSLQGEFSKYIYQLRDRLIQLRMFIEAAIDFPEEEIDFIKESTVVHDLANLINDVALLKQSTRQGLLLQEGMTIVLIGKPNVGKSSLLNCLSGQDSAIVTDIAGTTRDVLRERIHIDGLPLHIIDTAGLHSSENIIEQEGMRRTRKVMQQADLLILIVDASDDKQNQTEDLLAEIPEDTPLVIVRNKIDLMNRSPKLTHRAGYDVIDMSAKYQLGVDVLTHYLKNKIGYEQHNEGIYIARRRHLTAIDSVHQHVLAAQKQLKQYAACELVAEELAQAHKTLGEITGEFTADDLLGKIFSTFCIGK